MTVAQKCLACGQMLHRVEGQPGRVHVFADDAARCPLARSCPTCHAAQGAWCVRPSEHKAMDLHAGRFTFRFLADRSLGRNKEVLHAMGAALALDLFPEPRVGRGTKP